MDCRVYELFLSVEGETTSAGFPACFIRLAGCNLDCRWCDTPEARAGGTPVPVQAIVDRVCSLKAHHVTVTGGEPLCQEGCIPLMEAILAKGIPVQLETNGSLPLDRVPAGVRIIADVKTPSSGEGESFLMENLRCLGKGSEVKFVIADDDDYIFAKDFMERHLHGSETTVNLSPGHGTMPPARLAGMMLRDGLKARLNLQLHKIIWGESEEKIVL